MYKKNSATELFTELGKLLVILVSGLAGIIGIRKIRNKDFGMRFIQVLLVAGLIISGVVSTASAAKYDYDVPYINQLTETEIGESACGPTSIAMLLSYYYPNFPNNANSLKEVYHSGLQGYTYNSGPAAGYRDLSFQWPNDGFGLLDNYPGPIDGSTEKFRDYYDDGEYSGMRQSPAAPNYLNQIWGGESYGGAATFEDVVKKIKKGPLVMSIHNSLTTGHFIVLRGYDEGDKPYPDTSDDMFYINDPYPWDSLSKDDVSGENKSVKYSTLQSWYKGNIITLTPVLSEFQRKYTIVVDNNKVIVDNIDALDTAGKYIWREFYGEPGGDWLYSDETDKSKTHWAKWTPTLVDNGDGYYNITAIFYDNNAGDDVEYIVYRKDNSEIGRATVKQKNTGDWRNENLGMFYLAKAEEPYVKINNVPVDFNIDAMRFERIHGLNASYYNVPIYRIDLNADEIPNAVRIDPNVNFNWRSNPNPLPLGIARDDAWSVDWKGYIYVPVEGTYKFSLDSDDGSWLYINGAEVIANTWPHTFFKDVELKKGYNSILLKYYECCWGPAVISLNWKLPGTDNYVPVPQEALYVSAPLDQPALLKVSKKVSTAMSPGSEMTYTLYYQNFGGAYGSQAVLEDKLPPEVDFVSASDGIVPNDDGVLSWNIDSVAAFPDGKGSKTITVRINPDKVTAGTTVIENTATIKYGDQVFETKATTAVVDSKLPESVTVDNTRNNIGGETSVYWQDPIKFNYFSSCAKSVTINIHMDEGGADISAEMTEKENQWSYTVPQFAPRHGSATVTYTITGCEKSSVSFNIYIDPAGFIYDAATGARISGASVWLQQPDRFGEWNNVSTAEIPARMQPNENPLITNKDGQYQWDVLEGIYRVHVEAPGYYPRDSIVVNIPPPVFDLNVGLLRIEVPDSIAPNTTATFAGTLGNNGWYVSDVEVNLTAIDNEGGTGVNFTEYSFDNATWHTYIAPFKVSNEGTFVVYYRSLDNAGNAESVKSQAFKIDKTAPTVVINSPANENYALNQIEIVNWSANDSVSGIATVSATLPNGSNLDTFTVGLKTFNVNIIDNAGNEANKSVSYRVVYKFTGPLSPFKSDGNITKKAGSTVPVQIQLQDANGNSISGATARIYLIDSSGKEFNGTSAGNANRGNLFRQVSGGTYMYNLKIPSTPGTVMIKIVPDDEVSRYATITVK